MGSRQKEQTTPHQLSSLIVRPTDSGGGAASRGGAADGDSTGGASSDYEPGEVRRNDPPPYSRSDRFADSHAVNVAWSKNLGLEEGHRMRAGSVSPVHRTNGDHRYSPDLDHSGGPPRSRGFGSGRDTGRYRGYSPPYGRGRAGGRFTGRGFDAPRYGPGPFRGGAMLRNSPNVRPREGDWICPDPSCNNLNFARREYCNNCKRSRYALAGSPSRGYPGPLPPPPRRFPAPAMNRSPGRMMNGYRSPRGWAGDGHGDFRPGGPPFPRHEGRFSDPPIRRDRPDYRDDDYRERNRFDRPMPPDWGHRERDKDNFFGNRKMYERRPSSPLLPPGVPPRGHWDRDIRERSRSPVRGAALPKDYRCMYVGRGRDYRRGTGRGAY